MTRPRSLNATSPGRYGAVPGLIAPVRKLTPEEAAVFRERFGRAAHGPVRIIHPDGKARRRLPLPWRVRARLRREQAANGLGAWLCHHGHEDAALALWKALRMVQD